MPAGRLLARNATINLIGQGIPLFVAFFSIPPLMRGLGIDRFGVLTLTWMVIGYFSLFDLGLSRATTKFVAEMLGKGETEALPPLVWTSFVVHLVLGLGACLVLSLLTPFLVETALKIPATMRYEAKGIFFILSGALPVVLASTVLRGVVEAGQRFDLINMVQIPAGAAMFLLPLAGMYLGFGLAGIVSLLIAARIGTAIAFALLCRNIFPSLRNGFSFDARLIRPLFSFGSWLTISNVVGPLLLYLDRFMIGSIISVAAVTYYTAPYEIIIRLMVFPTSLVMVLFPAFSSLGTTSRDTVIRLYTRSMKYLVLLMGPLVLTMILFAETLLRLWLGVEFAQKSTLVLQILAFGMLLTPAQISVSLIHGLGRPDITAKFYLVELVLYIPIVWFLAARMGIAGAALAWTMRAALDTVLVIYASGRICSIRFRDFADQGVFRGILVLAALACVFLATWISALAVVTQAIVATIGILAFCFVSWNYILDTRDREILSFGRIK